MPTLELPYPPSVNTYWRQVRGRFYIAGPGIAYRKEVVRRLAEYGITKRSGRLAVEVLLYPPDKRRRDIDNALKSLLDALGHGGAYDDDSQIDRLSVARQERVEGGMTLVTITEL